MSEGRKPFDGNPVALSVCAGGFVWLVFDSLFFGLMAFVVTFFLLRRDAAEDGRGEDEF